MSSLTGGTVRISESSGVSFASVGLVKSHLRDLPVAVLHQVFCTNQTCLQNNMGRKGACGAETQGSHIIRDPVY